MTLRRPTSVIFFRKDTSNSTSFLPLSISSSPGTSKSSIHICMYECILIDIKVFIFSFIFSISICLPRCRKRRVGELDKATSPPMARSEASVIFTQPGIKILSRCLQQVAAAIIPLSSICVHRERSKDNKKDRKFEGAQSSSVLHGPKTINWITYGLQVHASFGDKG